MTEEDSFLRAIFRTPFDDDLLLVYADWLEESGAAAKAEFLRLTVQLGDPMHPRAERRTDRERCRRLHDEMPADWLRVVERPRLPTSWAWSDGWILAALYVARRRRGTTLAEILGAADAIMHALPTSNDLTRALAKMITLGIVRVKDDRYRIAKNRVPALRRALLGTSILWNKVGRCLRWLKEREFTGILRTPGRMTDPDIAAACEEYYHAVSRQREATYSGGVLP